MGHIVTGLLEDAKNQTFTAVSQGQTAWHITAWGYTRSITLEWSVNIMRSILTPGAAKAFTQKEVTIPVLEKFLPGKEESVGSRLTSRNKRTWKMADHCESCGTTECKLVRHADFVEAAKRKMRDKADPLAGKEQDVLLMISQLLEYVDLSRPKFRGNHFCSEQNGIASDHREYDAWSCITFSILILRK